MNGNISVTLICLAIFLTPLKALFIQIWLVGVFQRGISTQSQRLPRLLCKYVVQFFSLVYLLYEFIFANLYGVGCFAAV